MHQNAFLKYLKFEKRSGEHTLNAYKTDLSQLSAFLTEHWGKEGPDLSKADRKDLRAWVVYLMNQGLSSGSINRKLACLKSFYKFLEQEGYVELSPAETLKALKGEQKLPAFLKEKEINTLLDAVPFEQNEEGQTKMLILELLYGTGMRLSELINLRFSDIDRERQSIKLMGKGKKERIVPINSRLLEKLKFFAHITYRKEGDFLLMTKKGKQLYPMFVYRVVNAYLAEVCALEKRSPHVLRHTFATHLLNKGADINAIKKLLGHSSLAATQIYTHSSFEKIKEAFNQAHPKA